MFSKKNSFFRAVKRGDKEAVENLLTNQSFKKKYIDYEIPNTERTSLAMAIDKNDTDMAILLINNGANIYTAPKKYMLPATFFMVSREDYFLIDFILKNGNKKPLEPLIRKAVKLDKTRLVNYLINKGAKAEDNMDHIDRESLLAVAIKNKNITIVELLLKNGANVNKRGYRRNTPAMLAAEMGDLQIIKILVNSGANLNDQNLDGDSLISIAAFNKHNHIIEYLIEQGVDINMKNNIGETSLIIAARRGAIKTVEFLLNRGANPKVTSRKGKSILEVLKESRDTMNPNSLKLLIAEKEKLYEASNIWVPFGEDKIAHVDISAKLERRITEVFNFKAKTHFIISENLANKTESISSLMPFREVDDSSLKKAFYEYKKQGGKIDEDSAIRNIIHKRIIK